MSIEKIIESLSKENVLLKQKQEIWHGSGVEWESVGVWSVCMHVNVFRHV